MEQPGRQPRWYEGLTSTHWIMLAVASAGWIFDVYEGQLFTIFKTPMLRELTDGSPGTIDFQANIGLAAFLLGGALGGLFFGILGDRYGRLRIMSATILVYSVFSALTYFATTTWQVHVLRFLVALGTGGEWAVAAALVAETFPTRARAAASGLFHASSVIGVGLASVTGLIFVSPDSWRTAFLVGLLPSLLVVWIRASLREPKPSPGEDRSEGSVGVDFDRHDRRPDRTPPTTSLAESGPAWPWPGRGRAGDILGHLRLGTRAGGQDARHRRNARKEAVGVEPGLPVDELHRRSARPAQLRADGEPPRPSGSVRALSRGAGLLAPLTYLSDYGYAVTLGLLSLMSFFVLGMHAGYAIYFPELFPTRLRATGASICFNVGRVLGAVILLIRGELGRHLGMPRAAAVISCLFWVGLVLLWFTPETRGRELPE